MGDLDLHGDRVNDMDLVLLDGPGDLLILRDMYASREADGPFTFPWSFERVNIR